jgi:hypothetical protein
MNRVSNDYFVGTINKGYYKSLVITLTMITSIFSMLNNNKKIALVISLSFLVVSCDGIASGRCSSPSDTASDGSRCGGRSSSSRPGGK